MSTISNKDIVRSYIDDTYNKKDVSAVNRYIAPSFVSHDPDLGPDVHGVDEEVARVEAFRSAFPDITVAVDDQIAEGDKVACRFTVSGTQQGDLLGLAPTNRKVSWSVMTIWRVVNGQIVERWIQNDVLSLLQQLGAIPEEIAVVVTRS